MRAHVGSQVMNEADEEHHVAKVLIAELDHPGRNRDHRDAKFTVLAESVRHHIKEEENDMFPKAKELDIDFESLGKRMLDRKKELLKDGIPADAEHAMVAKANGHADSPAAAAGNRKAPARKVSASRKVPPKAAAANHKTRSSHASH